MNNQKLIRYIEKLKCLYNGERSKKLRDRAFECVATRLNTKADLVKKRWRSIRDAYTKRFNEKKGGEVLTKTYERYDGDLKFLDEFIGKEGEDQVVEARGYDSDESVESLITKYLPDSHQKQNEKDRTDDVPNVTGNKGENSVTLDKHDDEDDDDWIVKDSDEEVDRSANKKRTEELILGSSEADESTESYSLKKSAKGIKKADVPEEWKSRLIHLVRDHPAIYDARLASHKDRNLIDNIWRKIATELDAQPTFCCEMWSSMRNTFMNETKTVRTGEAAKKKNPVDLRLDFLLTSKIERASKTNLTPLPALNANRKRPVIEIIPDEEFCAPPEIKKKRKTKTDLMLEEMKESRQQFFSEFKLSKQNTVEEKITYKKEENGTGMESKNEIDVFFNTIAGSVKKLPPPIQAEVKMKILQVMNDVEVHIIRSQYPSFTRHPSLARYPNFARSPSPRIDCEYPNFPRSPSPRIDWEHDY